MIAVEVATVLFVSNDGVTASARATQLVSAGCRVIHASDQIEMLSAVKAGTVDLVILHIPAANLLDTDTTNILRRVSPGHYLPIMVLAESEGVLQRCGPLETKADDVISMDSSAAEMIARVLALLRIRDLHKQLDDSRAALQQALSRERRLLSKLRRDNEHLQMLCTTDPLTHVQNIRSFRDILGHEFRGAKRYNKPISMLALDLDHFKVVNDTCGHPSGNYVLKETAVILKSSVRESDVVARTGGDEFGIILPRAGVIQAADFAERIRKEVFRRRFVVYGNKIHVTTSIGSATFPADAHITSPEMLVYFADQALLAAKETGRDRLVCFNSLPQQVRIRIWHQHASSPITSGIEGEHPAEIGHGADVKPLVGGH